MPIDYSDDEPMVAEGRKEGWDEDESESEEEEYAQTRNSTRRASGGSSWGSDTEKQPEQTPPAGISFFGYGSTGVDPIGDLRTKAGKTHIEALKDMLKKLDATHKKLEGVKTESDKLLSKVEGDAKKDDAFKDHQRKQKRDLDSELLRFMKIVKALEGGVRRAIGSRRVTGTADLQRASPAEFEASDRVMLTPGARTPTKVATSDMVVHMPDGGFVTVAGERLEVTSKKQHVGVVAGVEYSVHNKSDKSVFFQRLYFPGK